MSYLKARWLHAPPGEPVVTYSELDDGRWELRKVEEMPDGSLRCADAQTPDDAATGLSLEPIPSLDEIRRDPQFLVEEISADEFEAVWNRAITACG